MKGVIGKYIAGSKVSCDCSINDIVLQMYGGVVYMYTYVFISAYLDRIVGMRHCAHIQIHII